MQLTVKAIKLLTKGHNDYGDWFLYKLTDTDGKVYTTLAEGAELLQPGAVFEPKEILLGEIKNDIQEYKFKKFSLISGGKAPVSKESDKPDEGASTSGMTPADWAKKDRLERWSREANACFMGLPALIAAKPIKPMVDDSPDSSLTSKAIEAWEAAMNYAKAHFTSESSPSTNPMSHWCEEHNTSFFMKGKMKSYAHPLKDAEETTVGWCYEHTPEGWTPPSEGTKSKSEGDDTKALDFSDVGKFYTALNAKYKLTPSMLEVKYAGLDLETPESREKAWEYINEKESAKKKDPPEALPGQSAKDIAGAKELFPPDAEDLPS